MCEIENVSMSALAAVLIQPAGLALEILYLDRSLGEEVNTYFFGAPENVIEATERPTFRLLYRP
jgi:ubiquitin thioesterase protein OTUB1